MGGEGFPCCPLKVMVGLWRLGIYDETSAKKGISPGTGRHRTASTDPCGGLNFGFFGFYSRLHKALQADGFGL